MSLCATSGRKPKPKSKAPHADCEVAFCLLGRQQVVRFRMKLINVLCRRPGPLGRWALSQSSSARRISEALAEAENNGEPFEYLHILAHGGQIGSSFGLLLDCDEGDSSGVDPGRLRLLLGRFTSTLRVIVVAACDSGNVGELGNQLGSVAQAMHRVGFRAVVASRFALSTAGSEVLAEAFYQAHIVDKLSVEQAVARARVRLAGATGNLDWASLQLYARAADDATTSFASPTFYPKRQSGSNRFVGRMAGSKSPQVVNASSSSRTNPGN